MRSHEYEELLRRKGKKYMFISYMNVIFICDTLVFTELNKYLLMMKRRLFTFMRSTRKNYNLIGI